ncbi:MAG TPA: P-II family nitrogen regulator [Mycobacterium sp.]|nr:P-II family nitrogen regulator [Mycobacterium sp.]HQC76146.1 P-II family nitrogen regulator [Mycobacterium sp.]
MKTITIITEQMSDKSLTAILPGTGIASVTVTEGPAAGRDSVSTEEFRGFCNPRRFSPNYRIDVVLDDAAVGTLFDSIEYAYTGGFFGDAEAWVNTAALAA